MAAFHLIIYGRFWVITEGQQPRDDDGPGSGQEEGAFSTLVSTRRDGKNGQEKRR
jgi:hypothetical protein